MIAMCVRDQHSIDMIEHILQLDVGQRQLDQWDAALVGGISHRRHGPGRAKHRVYQDVQAFERQHQGCVAENMDLHITSFIIADCRLQIAD